MTNDEVTSALTALRNLEMRAKYVVALINAVEGRNFPILDEGSKFSFPDAESFVLEWYDPDDRSGYGIGTHGEEIPIQFLWMSDAEILSAHAEIENQKRIRKQLHEMELAERAKYDEGHEQRRQELVAAFESCGLIRPSPRPWYAPINDDFLVHHNGVGVCLEHYWKKGWSGWLHYKDQTVWGRGYTDTAEQTLREMLSVAPPEVLYAIKHPTNLAERLAGAEAELALLRSRLSDISEEG